jgi:[ribosomal protein S5]-alanine N-acetyltransferase
MEDFPTITTDRLVLREIVSSDSDAVFRIFSNDQVTRFYDCDSYKNIPDAQRHIERINRCYAAGGQVCFRWGVAPASALSELIGTCGYHTVNKPHRSIMIGYELHPAYWGKGYAYEAVASMLGFCFKKDFPFVLNRVAATTNLDSEKSIKLLKRLGFTEEGILREAGFWKNKYHDLRLFSLLKKEWTETDHVF